MGLRKTYEEKRQAELMENELMEKYVPKRITVRQLIELITDDKECFITRGGKTAYYYGSVNEIPKCLLDLELIEFVPKFEKRDDGLGLSWYLVMFVYPNALLDMLAMNISGLATSPKYLYDDLYNSYVSRENPILDILREMDNRQERIAPVPLVNTITESEEEAELKNLDKTILDLAKEIENDFSDREER